MTNKSDEPQANDYEWARPKQEKDTLTRYEKLFHLHSVHFNGQKTYDWWKAAREAHDGGRFEEEAALLRLVLGDIHGHRFEIKVMASRHLPPGVDWVVDDMEMTRLVMEWEHKTLSILPEFDLFNVRATTEQLARVLYRKLAHHFPDVWFNVSVQETADITATYHP